MVREGEGEAARLVGREGMREGHLDRRTIRVARRGGGGGAGSSRAGGMAVGGGLGHRLGLAPPECEDDAVVRLAEELERPARDVLGVRALQLGAVRDEVALQRHHVLHVVAAAELGEHAVLRPEHTELRGAAARLHAGQQHVHVPALAAAHDDGAELARPAVEVGRVVAEDELAAVALPPGPLAAATISAGEAAEQLAAEGALLGAGHLPVVRLEPQGVVAGDVRGRGRRGELATSAGVHPARRGPSEAAQVSEGGEAVEGPALRAREREAERHVAARRAVRRRAQPHAQLAPQRARHLGLDGVEQDLADVARLAPAEPAHRRAQLARERALHRLQPRLLQRARRRRRLPAARGGGVVAAPALPARPLHELLVVGAHRVLRQLLATRPVLEHHDLAPVQIERLLARPALRLRGGERLLRDPKQLRVARPRNEVEPQLRRHRLHVGALQPPAWQRGARP
eukprot:scaffold39662_cov49-Phaeocystis_antarctica.AAC.4